MERMKSKCLVGFLIGCFICMLMVLPSFVYADVTINTANWSSNAMVDLELATGHESRIANVTSTGSVITAAGNAALWAKVGGWTINVADGINPNVSGVFYGVLFNVVSDRTGINLDGTLNNSGVIVGMQGVGMGSGTIYNYGSIEGNNNAGIYMDGQDGPGNKTIMNDGSITGHQTGIYISDSTGTTMVANYGTITGTDNAGIYVYNLSGTTYITNDAGAEISSTSGSGIYIGNEGTVDVNNRAGGRITISAGDDESSGIYVNNSGSANVTNSGDILVAGNDAYGISIENGGVDARTYVANTSSGLISAYHGIYISNADTSGSTVNVTNSGVITSTHEGISGTNLGTLYVANSGVITSSAGAGAGIRIMNRGTTTVINSGTISAPMGPAIDLFDGGSDPSTVIVTNSGTISGYTGIWSRGEHSSATIFNSGTITATAAEGGAINLYGVNNHVTLATGSVITGFIEAPGLGGDHFILDGHGTLRAEQIQHFNTLEKTGAGTWILTGDDHSGFNDITVTAGVLALAARGEGGHGWHGGVVTDDFTQMPGASLGFVVTATGDTGGLTVGGMTTADFNNGTIVVIPTAGHYAKTTTYENVLTANNIDNKWTQVTGTAFLKPYLVEDVEYDGVGESYDLILKRRSFKRGAWLTLGIALDHIYDDVHGDMRDVLDQLIVLGPGDADDALTQMGGGTHAAFQFMSFYGLNKYHGALNNHLGGGSGFTGGSGFAGYQNNGYPQAMQTAMAASGTSMSDAAPMLLAAVGNLGTVASGTKWDLWTDGYYSKGDRSSTDVITRYNSTLYGGLIGFDYRATDKLLIGISAGISNTDVKFEDLLDKGEMDSYQGSVYTYYDAKPWYVEGVLTYAYNKYEMNRVITIGDITRYANSEYNGSEYAGYAEVGYKLDAGGIVMIRPMVGFQAAYLMQDAYTETGAGDLNLSVDDRDTGSYQSYLGLHISKAITMGNFVLTPEARAKWAHEFSTDDHLINARFAGAGSGSFTVEADRPSRETAILGLGINGKFNKNLSMYIQYDAELNSDYTNHTGMMGLRLAW